MKSAVTTLVMVVALSACDKPAYPTAATETIKAQAQSGLSLTDGRLVLPAVKANPGAAYFKLANASDRDTALTAVEVAGATRAEMHETSGSEMTPLKSVPLGAANSVIFAPGGKHVMVFGLDPAIEPGATHEMTLTFADGERLTGPLKVEVAGGAMEHMH